jgi:hypothetical protein
MKRREMAFEKYLTLIPRMSESDIHNCIGEGNVFVNILTSPTHVKEGLIRTGKFILREYDRYLQGKFQLDHIATGALVLVKYEGVNEDYDAKKWRRPEPNESYISMHPGDVNNYNLRYNKRKYKLEPCFIARRVLPDILEFGKAEQVELSMGWRVPLIYRAKSFSGTKDYLVRYDPKKKN